MIDHLKILGPLFAAAFAAPAVDVAVPRVPAPAGPPHPTVRKTRKADARAAKKRAKASKRRNR